MMCFVFRARRRVKGKLCVSRMFTGQFRLAGDIKPTRVPLCVTDKQVAEKKLRGFVREAEREREGLSLPKEQRDAAKQSVESYVQEFVESRRGLKRDEKYVRELERKPILLAAGGQSVSPSESASVGESPELADGARCRVRHRQAGRRQRGTDSACAAEGLGGQRPHRTGEGAADPGGGPAGLQPDTVRRKDGLARRPDRS